MHLTRLVYASNHGGIDEETLDQILHRSRCSNRDAGITGLLVAGEEDFLQMLEGGRAAIAACFARIMQDIRHRDIRVLLAGSIPSRTCTDWNMHSVQLSKVDAAIVARYWTDGSFNPGEMSDADIDALCRDLARVT